MRPPLGHVLEAHFRQLPEAGGRQLVGEVIRVFRVPVERVWCDVAIAEQQRLAAQPPQLDAQGLVMGGERRAVADGPVIEGVKPRHQAGAGGPARRGDGEMIGEGRAFRHEAGQGRHRRETCQRAAHNIGAQLIDGDEEDVAGAHVPRPRLLPPGPALARRDGKGKGGTGPAARTGDPARSPGPARAVAEGMDGTGDRIVPHHGSGSETRRTARRHGGGRRGCPGGTAEPRGAGFPRAGQVRSCAATCCGLSR